MTKRIQSLPSLMLLSALMFIGTGLLNKLSAADFVVTNTNDAGAGSLRAAIDSANNSLGGSRITFNIPGGGPYIITLSSELPVIYSDFTVIDGSTQPGVVLVPSGSLAYGLFIEANYCTVNGLGINGFDVGVVIQVDYCNTVIENCTIANSLYRGIDADFANNTQIRQNSMYCNGADPLGDPFIPSTNANQPPEITNVTATEVSGIATYMTPTPGFPGNVVEVFIAGDPSCPGVDIQGKTFFGDTIVNPDGTWTVAGNVPPGAILTATVTNPAECYIPCDLAPYFFYHYTDSISVHSGEYPSGSSNITEIVFSGFSFGSPTSWYWDFGDGDTSTFQNPPPHGYIDAGYYNVCLTVSNITNGELCEETYCEIVDAGCGMTPDFYYEITPNTTEVLFTDNSSGSPTSWEWDFGDDSTSTDQNPDHVYAPGTYYVCLTVTDSITGCSISICDSITIINPCDLDPDPLIAFFDYDFTNFPNPFEISFYPDDSQGSPTSWFWDFGDDSTSILDYPLHTYAASGYYYVCLTISKDVNGTQCEDTYCKTIDIGCSMKPDFTGDLTPGTTEWVFTDISTGSPISWLWDFGDDSTSTEQYPVHEYDAPGEYIVCLTVTNAANCSSEVCYTVDVPDPCDTLAKFQAVPCGDCCVEFINLSTGDLIAWFWDFGDGETSTDSIPPPHIYSYGVEFEVCLTVLTIDSCENTYCAPVATGCVWEEAVTSDFSTPYLFCIGYADTLNATICADSTYDFYGDTLNMTGTYDTTFMASNGCDSTIVLNLTVLDTSLTILYDTICYGEVYDFYGIPLEDSGTYDTVFAGFNGCDSTIVLNLTVLPELTASIAETDNSGNADDMIICPGGSADLDAEPMGGVAPYTYTWDNGLPASEMQTVSPVATMTYHLTVTDAAGCAASAEKTIIVNPALTASIAETDNSGNPNDLIICPGGTANLDANPAGGVAPYAYIWDNGLPATEMQAVAPVATSIYSMTVTDANGCAAFANVTITVNPALTAAITETDNSGNPNDLIICPGGSADLDANPAGGVSPYVYSWDNGLPAMEMQTVSPVATTMYSVTVTDINGCEASAGMTITVNPALTTAITETDNSGNPNDLILCPGGSADLDANPAGGVGPYVYSWDNGLPAMEIQTVSPVATTMYSVTVTDFNGCEAFAGITITVVPAVSVSIGETDNSGNPNDLIICPGGTANLDANPVGGVAPYTYTWDNGLPAMEMQTVAPVAMTTYNVTVTDAAGCVASAGMTLTVNPALTAAIAGTDNSGNPNDLIICPGGTANLDANPVGGVSPYAYTWDNGLPATEMQTVSPLVTTTYNVTVTDVNGCEAFADLTITVIPAVTATIAETDNSGNPNDLIICPGGTADLNANPVGGMIPYTYTWDNGLPATEMQTVLPVTTTTYNLTVTDANGCAAFADMTITVNPALTAPIAETDNSGNPNDLILCPGGTADLDANPAGGMAPYTYTWDNGLPATEMQTVTPVATTTYNLTVTDASGCVASAGMTITVNPALTAAIAGTDNSGNPNDLIICPGGTANLDANPVGGVSPYAYTWDNGLPATEMQTVSPLVTTTYNVTVTDINGCEAFANLTVTVIPSVTAAIAETDNSGNPNDLIICPGGTADLDANPVGGVIPYSYTWDNGLPATEMQTVSPVTTTTYNLTVTDANGCVAFADMTIMVNPALTAQIAETDNSGNPNDLILCPGGSADLNANPAGGMAPYTYTWDNGLPATEMQTVTPVATTTYNLTVTDASGCVVSAGITVTVNSVLTATIAETDNSGNPNDLIICPGGTANLDANPAGGVSPYTYTWDNGLPATEMQTVSPVATTTYNVTVTDVNGCETFAAVTITVNPALTAAIAGTDNSGNPNDMIICPGGSADLDANPVGGVGPYVFSWDNGLLPTEMQTVSPMATTTYNVTVTDANGCEAFAAKTITVNPALTATIAETDNSGNPNDLTICPGGSANLNANPAGGVGPYSYSWDNGLPATKMLTVSPLATTTYNVTVTDASGCEAFADVTITVNPVLTATIAETDNSGNPNDMIICPGGTADLDANPAGGISPYTYTWDNGLPATEMQTVSPIVTTTYNLTVTDVNGCDAFAGKTITVIPALTATIAETDNSGNPNDLIICPGGSANMDVNPVGGLSPFTYSWDNGLPATEMLTVSPLATTTYNVTVTDANGCDAFASMTITVNPVLTAVIAEMDNSGNPNDLIICPGGSADLDANPAGGVSPYTYSWDNGLPATEMQTVTPVATTTYNVTVTDTNGCVAFAGRTITVNPVLTATISETDNSGNANDLNICPGGSANLNAEPVGGASPYTYTWNNGLPPTKLLTVSPVITTTYNVTVTDANGCETSADITITVSPAVNASIAATENSGNANDLIICPGGSADLDANPVGGISPYTYTWDNGLPATEMQTVSPLTTTTYSVTVTDTNGCSAFADETITVNPALTAAIAETDNSGNADDMILCPGGTANLDANPVGGVGPFQYVWDNGLPATEMQTVSPVATTTYNLTVTDANACQETGSITIVVNPNPMPVITITDNSGTTNDDGILCSGDNASLNAGVFAAYLWSDMSTTQTLTTGIAGPYTVTVTDAAGCQASAGATISVNTAPIALISETDNSGNPDDLIICPGGSADLDADPVGGAAPYTYTWNNGLPATEMQTVSPLATTTYNVTVADANACASTFGLEIVVANTYLINLDVSICLGSTYDFAGNTYDTSGIYTGFFSSVAGCDSTVILNLTVDDSIQNVLLRTICAGDSILFDGSYYSATGMYTATYTTTSGCDSTVIMDLTVLDTFATALNATICAGESFSAGGTDFDATGVYTVVVPASNGCDSTIILDLIVLDTFATALNATICAGETYPAGGTDFDATGVYTVVVPALNGCDSTIILDLTVLDTFATALNATICAGETYPAGGTDFDATGVYTVVVPASNGCDSTIILDLVVLDTFETALIETICAGETYAAGGTDFDATGVYTVVVPASNGCDSTIILNLTVLDTAATALNATICGNESYNVGGQEFDSTGTYLVTLSAANGCDSIVTLNLLVYPVYQVDQQATICQGDSLFVGGAYQFLPGIYADTLVTANGCDSIFVTELTVNNLPSVVINAPPVICPGTPIDISVGSFSTYLWSPGGETTAVITITQPGTYAVTVTDVNGCSGSDVVNILQNCEPVISNFTVSQDTACVQHLVYFTDQSSSNATSWFWDFGNGNFSDQQNPFDIYPNTGTFTVSLVVSDGIISDTSYRQIYVYPHVVANFIWAIPDSCESNVVAYTDTSQSLFPIETWKWNFGDGNYDAGQNPVHEYAEYDLENVGLVIIDIYGCLDSINLDVPVLNYASPGDIANAGEDLLLCQQPSTVNLAATSSTLPNVTGAWSQSATQAQAGVVIVSPTDPNTQVTGLQADNIYEFTWTLSASPCGDYSSDVVLVDLTADFLLQADAGLDQHICPPETDVLLSANQPAGTTGVWTTGGTAAIESPQSPETEVNSLSPGENIFVWTISSNDCPGYSSDTVVVSAYSELRVLVDTFFNLGSPPNVRLDLLANDVIPNSPQIGVDLITTPSQGSLSANGDGSYTFTASADLTENVYFTYEVCVNDCPGWCERAEVTLLATLPPGPLPPLLPPANVITPNGDGTGDAVLIPNYEYFPDGIQFTVLSRWGDVVYETKNYDNNWQGTNGSGKPLPDGTYYYIIRAGVQDDQILQGTITIMR